MINYIYHYCLYYIGAEGENKGRKVVADGVLTMTRRITDLEDYGELKAELQKELKLEYEDVVITSLGFLGEEVIRI